jgi:hypothetical protein
MENSQNVYYYLYVPQKYKVTEFVKLARVCLKIHLPSKSCAGKRREQKI